MSLLSRKYNFALAALLAMPTLVVAQAPQASAAPTAAPVAAAAAAPQRRVRRSWTSDRREFVAGDLITVVVDEFTLASANKDNVDSDRRRRNMSIGIDVQTGTPPGTSIDANIGTRNDAESSQRGEATRQNRFQSEISVRILAIDAATGLLQVEGSKTVDVDRNKETVMLKGWVRPEDVSRANVVLSSRVANAEVIYQGKNQLAKPRGGILGRIFGLVWP